MGIVPFKIRPILESDWPAIDIIQKEAYPPEANEDLETMKCHWKLAPEFCFVADGNGELYAYLITHPWKKRTSPPINVEYHSISQADSIFIHDIAMKKSAQKKGIGRELVRALFEAGSIHGYTAYNLISVQNTRGFWEGLGFKVVTDLPPGYFQGLATLYPNSSYYYMERDE